MTSYKNFEEARRVARMLESYPVYRSLDPEQRNALLTLALRGGFAITAAGIADAIEANNLRETTND